MGSTEYSCETACKAFVEQGVKRVVGILALGRGTPMAQGGHSHGFTCDGRPHRRHARELPRAHHAVLYGQHAAADTAK